MDAHHRYEIVVDGKRVGVTEYRDHGEQRVFFHAEVDDAYAGQGLAAADLHRQSGLAHLTDQKTEAAHRRGLHQGTPRH
ncbi:hypothetical protein GCM10023080_078120 [Streptomyces pseudoechinosporeus]